MIATTLKETEAAPAAYPAVDHWDGDFRDPLPGDPSVSAETTWQRIEAWINTRWTSRAVVCIAEGPGEWCARLAPFTISTTEIWQSSAWSTVTLDPSPLGGLVLPGPGPYRITGTAGDDTAPPEAVLEAWRCLHEFQTGIAFNKHDETGALQSGDTQMVRGWAAKAMQLSGAADLLRPWRKL